MSMSPNGAAARHDVCENHPQQMLSGFFVFNAKGEVLISRLYRNDIKYTSSVRCSAN
ncbi:hypothetical protein BC830DRAFT_1171717 [Chytriomyces sp. MP71]|nr:hypothetical protein BC830DRAFT_1171717 [Chytriomyces sp. MP71]